MELTETARAARNRPGPRRWWARHPLAHTTGPSGPVEMPCPGAPLVHAIGFGLCGMHHSVSRGLPRGRALAQTELVRYH